MYSIKKIDKIEATGYNCRIFDLQCELLERMDASQVKRFDLYLGRKMILKEMKGK